VNFRADRELFEIRNLVGNLRMGGVQRHVFLPNPIVLLQNVVADGIDEGSQTARLAQTSIRTNSANDPCKGFLAEVIDDFRHKASRPKLQAKKAGKIVNKVGLRGSISLPEPPQVGFVKSKKFQHFPRSFGKYSRASKGSQCWVAQIQIP